jgi:arylsulfatase A-like enzyme
MAYRFAIICGLLLLGCTPRGFVGSTTPKLGEGWHALSDVYRDAYALENHGRFTRRVDVPPDGWLDVAIGTKTPGPVTFRIHVATSEKVKDKATKPIFEERVDRPDEWRYYAVDLHQNTPAQLTLDFSIESKGKESIGLWSMPRVRRSISDTEEKPSVPTGIILIWVDTLRADHLDLYGYSRETAPALTRFAREGVWFSDVVSQSNWTLPATASLLTATVPSTHGVADFFDRIPSAIETLAEYYQRANYATISFSSILYTGMHANAHRGFDVVHEATSLPNAVGSKTARVYVDRLLPWLDMHRKVPFFVFLHVYDPHSPYKPEAPYNELWVDKRISALFPSYLESFRDRIDDPFLKRFGVPNRSILIESGIDPTKYVAQVTGWYDGSIKAMDAQIARIQTKLDELGIDKSTLLVISSDHGEEFLEHDRMYHGQSLYSELVQVPLIMRWPDGIPAGKVVKETAQIIDIMPTLLEFSELEGPKDRQGRSLVASIREIQEFVPRPVFSERVATKTVYSPPPRGEYQVAMFSQEWKLIQIQKGNDKRSRYELFNRRQDPFDRHNLAKQHPEIVQRLEKEILAWKNESLILSKKQETGQTFDLSQKMIDRMKALGYSE